MDGDRKTRTQLLDDVASLPHQLAVLHAARSRGVAKSLKLSNATREAGCSHRQGGAVEGRATLTKDGREQPAAVCNRK